MGERIWQNEAVIKLPSIAFSVSINPLEIATAPQVLVH